MRQLHTDVSPPSDLEVLLDRLQELRRLVADVARVEASLVPHDLAERGELVGRSEGARRVDEPRCEPDGPLVHRLREECAHSRELLLRRRAIVRPDRKSTRLNSSHRCISYAVFCLKKKTQ